MKKPQRSKNYGPKVEGDSSLPLGGPRGPHDPRAYQLAILTALIDPQAVRQAKFRGTRPEAALFTALHLLDSIDDFLKGPSARYYSAEEMEQVRELYSGFARKSWPLDGTKFSLEDAVKQPWCTHKTVRHLEELLRRNNYPFKKFFELNGLDPYITKEAYKTALIKDREREQKLDRERKRKGAKEKKSTIATGRKRPTSGRNGQTSGKFRPTFAAA